VPGQTGQDQHRRRDEDDVAGNIREHSRELDAEMVEQRLNDRDQGHKTDDLPRR